MKMRRACVCFMTTHITQTTHRIVCQYKRVQCSINTSEHFTFCSVDMAPVALNLKHTKSLSESNYPRVYAQKLLVHLQHALERSIYTCSQPHRGRPEAAQRPPRGRHRGRPEATYENIGESYFVQLERNNYSCQVFL